MKTEETNDGRQKVAVGNDITEADLPAAGHNNLQGADPFGSIYQCPEKCEGGRTYEQPLNCPLCNKKLILVVK